MPRRIPFTKKDSDLYIARIRASVHDPEVAHSIEDSLYVATLAEIAHGHEDPVALAKAALRATKIKYERWYA